MYVNEFIHVFMSDQWVVLLTMWLLILKVLNSSEFPSRMLKWRWVWLEFISTSQFKCLHFHCIFSLLSRNNLLTFHKYGASVRFWRSCCKNVAGGIMQTFSKVLQPSQCKQFLYCSCQHFTLVIFSSKLRGLHRKGPKSDHYAPKWPMNGITIWEHRPLWTKSSK